jgi:hypothetical protein
LPHEIEDILDGLLTGAERTQLLENGKRRQQHLAVGSECNDLLPVVMLFTPDAGCVWLLASLDPADPDIGYGLCDLGIGYPELGTVSLAELASVRGKLGLPVQRHASFVADKTINEYEKEARILGHVEV